MKPPDPDPSTEDRLVQILEKLSESAQASGLSAQQLETLLSKVGITSAEAMRLSLKPENAEHAHISAFFTPQDKERYGSYLNKPVLRRRTFFVGVEEKDERLTPAEIEGYNRIQKSCEARHGRWKALVTVAGEKEMLQVQVPCESLEDRMELRPLVLILHELNGGQSTEDLSVLLRQIENLQALAVKQGATTQDLEHILLHS